jgi:hypothetical protein
MGSRTTIEVAVRFHEPSWIIANVGGISRTHGLAVGIVLRKGHSHSFVCGTRNQLKSSGLRRTSSSTISPRNDSSSVMGSDSCARSRHRGAVDRRPAAFPLSNELADQQLVDSSLSCSLRRKNRRRQWRCCHGSHGTVYR